MERMPIEQQIKNRRETLDKAKENGFEYCEKLPDCIAAIGEKEGKIFLITHEGEGIPAENFLSKENE